MPTKSHNIVLSIKDLCLGFKLQDAYFDVLKNVSFDIAAGKITALVGESGSGKSIISQAIMGILPSNAVIKSGSIEYYAPDNTCYNIKELTAHNAKNNKKNKQVMRELRGEHISIIFQEPMTSLSPLHCIGDQIEEVLKIHKKHLSTIERRTRVYSMLEKVGFPNPETAYNAYPFELSGGLRQRAMICIALISGPSLLIADEPTTALDVTIQAQIVKLMRDLQQEFSMSMLLITHDLGLVANMAHEVVVIYHGDIMEKGSVRCIFERTGHAYTKALLNAVPTLGTKVKRLMPLRPIDTHIRPNKEERKKLYRIDGKTPILEVRNLQKTYILKEQPFFGSVQTNYIKAVNDVNFTLMRGECLGIVGESGCGKTTLSKLLMGAITPDSGDILYHDEDVTNIKDLQGDALLQHRRRMQFVFQDPFSSLSPRMTIKDILSEPLNIHNIGTPQERLDIICHLMDMIGLDQRFLGRYPHSFSGGQRQRLGIARALTLNPDLLILDEPVSALDVSIQAQILNLLSDLQKKLGLTYIFISHNLAVVNYIADRILVMCRGRVVEVAPCKALFKNPIHPYTKGLLAAIPEANLRHKLDFTKILEEKASLPEYWPEPFNDAEGACHLVEIEPEHFVRVEATMAGKVA